MRLRDASTLCDWHTVDEAAALLGLRIESVRIIVARGWVRVSVRHDDGEDMIVPADIASRIMPRVPRRHSRDAVHEVRCAS
jgi:hypothetical protein